MFSQRDNVDITVLNRLIDKQLGDLLVKYDLITDSRLVNANSIFCAYPGLTSDGREYITQAIKMGAKVIIYEGDGKELIHDKTIPHIPVKGLMHYVGLLASKKYQEPSKRFVTIGVTGTNGKTSITHWINQAYKNFNKRTAIVGTIGAGIYPQIKDYSYTTPDPITLQKLCDNFAKHKVDLLAMEVSSHSLDQGRVNGLAFETAIFTNLTQDHLDYHHNMEDYYLAKSSLFYWQGLKCAIINIDDVYGKRLVDELKRDDKPKSLNIITYGISSSESKTDVGCYGLYASDIKIKLDGMQFKIHYESQVESVKVQVIGKFNVYNLLAVAAHLLSHKYNLRQVTEVLSELTPVCGRMDTIRSKESPLIVVDYAHTPDALENTLKTLRDVEHNGKLYCIFGCGGNRDATKRPLMGEIASRIADYAYITSDNPRNEDPDFIIRQIVAGINKNNYETITNRAEAIRAAIMNATSDDIILIAGKGHETYQEINGIKNHFSDFEIANNVLGSKI